MNKEGTENMIVDEILEKFYPLIVQGVKARNLGKVSFVLTKIRDNEGSRSDGLDCELVNGRWEDGIYRQVCIWVAMNEGLDGAVMLTDEEIAKKAAWVLDRLSDHAALPLAQKAA